jgi:hypothetical protein
MPLLESLTEKITDRMPSMIGARFHSFADFAVAGAFLLYGAAAWNRDKRVAVSSAGCGLFALVSSALTDYSGGEEKLYPVDISSRLPLDAHARIDLGLAAMTGAMPSFMGLKDKYDKRFFRLQAISIVAIAGLTDFVGTGERKQLKRFEKSEAKGERMPGAA